MIHKSTWTRENKESHTLNTSYNMNTYQLSNGTRLSKSIIDSRVRAAKQELIDNYILEFGYVFCSKCKRASGVSLDCAHKISVDECQKQGRSELAYDVDNIEVLCRDCHKKRDGLDLKFKI